ncbi:MAG: acyl-CoA thioesterase II [Oleiphilus sp.]|nr:MAG: acyl-CoA thioesterase II [Oleiphilus sp.]
MQFTSLLNKVRTGASTVAMSPDWMQGRSTFGGLAAALVFESMRKVVKSEAPVRCIQISFVGPVSDTPLQIQSEVLRAGKSVTHVLGRGIQDGETKIVLQASFGHARDSEILVSASRMLPDIEPEDCQKLPYIDGVTPTFTRHFDFRYATPFPFGGSDLDYLKGYVRFAEPEPEWSEAHLLGLIDAWPPTTIPQLKKPAMASSLSWTVEFVQPLPALTRDAYTFYESHIVQSANGYGHTRARIWNQSGELMAISQQTVTHFA